MILIISPLIFYAIRFYSFPISNEPNEWSSIGSYISGTVGTIISLLSLIILTIITVEIQNLSSLENEKSLIRERKRTAYDNLSQFVPILNAVPKKIIRNINITNTKQSKLQVSAGEPSLIGDAFQNISAAIVDYIEYHTFLYTFNVRYSHLFTYDNNDENLQKAIETSDQFLKSLEVLNSNLLNHENFKPDQLQADLDNHVDYLTKFVNTLRDEIISEKK